MPLKLDRLPEREPARITFSASPALKAALADYAEVYRRTYGTRENVAELIPFMLDAFMTADPGFRKARRELAAPRGAAPETPQPAARHPAPDAKD